MLTYRQATEQDLDFLLQLREQTMIAYLEQAGIAIDRATHLSRIKYQFENAQIVEWQHQRIGLLKTQTNHQAIEIIQIQIAPAYQGKGLGKQVLQSVIAQGKSQQLKISLSVLKQNPAFHLYQRLGFVLVSEDEKSYYLEYTY